MDWEGLRNFSAMKIISFSKDISPQIKDGCSLGIIWLDKFCIFKL